MLLFFVNKDFMTFKDNYMLGNECSSILRN